MRKNFGEADELGFAFTPPFCVFAASASTSAIDFKTLFARIMNIAVELLTRRNYHSFRSEPYLFTTTGRYFYDGTDRTIGFRICLY